MNVVGVMYDARLGLGDTVPLSPLSPSNRPRPVAETEVRKPAEVFAFGDVPLNCIASPSPDPHTGNYLITWPLTIYGQFNLVSYSKFCSARGFAFARALERRRHAGIFDVVFADAHVESLKPARLFSRDDPEVFRRWNIDNEPHANLARKWLTGL